MAFFPRTSVHCVAVGWGTRVLWHACGGQNCFRLPLTLGVLRLLIHITASGFLCRFQGSDRSSGLSLTLRAIFPALILILALYSHRTRCTGCLDYFHKSTYCMLGILSPMTLSSSLSSRCSLPVVHCFLRKFHFYLNVTCKYMTLHIYIKSRNVNQWK